MGTTERGRRFWSTAIEPHQSIVLENAVAAPENLTDLYTGELQDLWSANDQMAKVLKKISGKVSDAALKEMLSKSQEGIARHTEILKQLLADSGEKVKKEHCKGMQGLVAEATEHTIEEAPKKGPVLDAVIIPQYQHMTDYGIAGFGTAAACAKGLELDNEQKAFSVAVKDMYRGDDYLSEPAETTVNVDAMDK